MSRAAVTLSDVAREAGVSVATASRAINGSAGRNVSAELRGRVLEAAARLRYSPDANAQAMARGQTIALALVVHDITDPYFSTIAAGVSDAADRAGLIVTLATTGRVHAREIAFVDLMQRQRARAIIVAGGRSDDAELNASLAGVLGEYRSRGGGVAAIGQPLLGVDTVMVESERSSADLARRLHGIGYRRFAMLAGPVNHLTTRDRAAGFREATDVLGAGIRDEHVVHSPFTRDGGYTAMSELVRRGVVAAGGRTAPGPAGGPEPVQLVFAVNDVMAVGAMAAARDAGLVVPRDVAVAGFDDIVTLLDVVPSLTTIRLPLSDMGAMATELALSPPAAAPRLVPVDGTVVLRDSTPPLG